VTQDLTYLIVEDLEIVSIGLKMALDEFTGLNLVGIAKDGEEAIQMAASLKPALIIMDLGLPKLNGIDATRKICQTQPQTKVLIMSSREKLQDVFSSFAAGAQGYCRKETPISLVYESMLSLVRGDIAIDPAIAGNISQGWKEFVNDRKIVDKDGQPFELKQDQQQLLSLIREGLNNAQIKSKLDLADSELDKLKQSLKQSLMTIGTLLSKSEITKESAKND
jgi:DNA-binding NarL/FixJ family response regulator